MDDYSPKKPWYRARNIFLLVLILCIGLGAWHVVRSLTAVPGSGVDYGKKLQELSWSSHPGATEKDNAMPILARAFELQTRIRERIAAETGVRIDRVDFDTLWTPFDPSAPDANQDEYNRQLAAARALLEAYRAEGVFDLAAEAAEKTVFVRPRHEGRLIDLMLPELSAQRHLARALAARMRIAGNAGDTKEFTDSFRQGLALGRVLSTEPFLISQLVSFAITQTLLEAARETVMSDKATPEMLRAMAEVLDAHPGLAPHSLAMKGEHICLLDIIQWTHTDDGNGDGRRIVAEAAALSNIGSGVRPNPLMNLASPLYPSKKNVTSTANDFYERLIVQADMTPAERLDVDWKPEVEIEGLPWNYEILKLLVPAVQNAFRANDRVRADLDGMRVLVAIERFRADKGTLPASLDELVPQYIRALPADRYVATGTFRYKVLQAPDNDGRAYLLYSPGEDGADNDGTPEPPGRNRPGSTTRNQPFDLIINRVPLKE